MQHVDITVALAHGHDAVRALADAVAQADGGPSVQRTLANPARDLAGRADTVEVVRRVQRDEDA